MAKRHKEALAIQQGACNPSGVARALVSAIDEARAEGMMAQDCPAVRLIAHQLAFLLRVREIDDGLDVYSNFTRECEQKSEAAT